MSWSELPRIGDIFDRLKNGRHISTDDGALYKALAENENEFRDLFASLGFSLVHHDRGFFFFKSDARFSQAGVRIAVFFFILVEWLSDRGEPLEEALFTRLFSSAELPHLEQKRYRAYMSEAGVDDEDSLDNLLRQMERSGFIRSEGERVFRFRTPAYRLLDLCAEALRDGAEEAGR